MDSSQELLDEPKLSIASVATFLDISVQAVHHQLRMKNIVLPKLGNKTFINHNIARRLLNIQFKKKNIVGQIVKGGTGKTTTIDSIAACVNAFGAKVLKIDIDPQGNLTDLHNIDPDSSPVLIDVLKGECAIEDTIISINPGLDIIPSRIENVVIDNTIVNERQPLDKFFSNVLSDVKDNYDFIFIDCPPTMGQAVTAASLFADLIVAPLNPDKFSTKGLEILRKEIKRLNKMYKKDIDYKVYLNKFSSKTILSDKTVMSLISDEDLSHHVLSTTIQFSQEVPNLNAETKNVFGILKKSSVREDFSLLTQELLDFSKEDVRPQDQKVKKEELDELAIA